ncbi:uncharacterized protein LOC143184698 isoform X2 [Calliopsis andreniformis]|uniref:uncharacterized protein LOC143184698 isoform X2 n=1 Tax=Calliopsis andreniformis TaxID=337506 RepID=UPI003FCD0962
MAGSTAHRFYLFCKNMERRCLNSATEWASGYFSKHDQQSFPLALKEVLPRPKSSLYAPSFRSMPWIHHHGDVTAMEKSNSTENFKTTHNSITNTSTVVLTETPSLQDTMALSLHPSGALAEQLMKFWTESKEMM